MGDRDVLDEILSNDTYVMEKAARADASSEEAHKAWTAIWEKLEQDKVKAEYAKARALYQDQGTEENERRMKALQEQVTRFSRAAE